jgi:cobalt/nickel transport system ATP-binding protein
MSSGERRRLALAAVLGSGRALLLFDRPTAGLDPEGQERFWQALRDAQAAVVVAVLDAAEAARCDLLLALPGRGEPEPAADLVPRALGLRAGWPPSPLAQLAAALLGEAADIGSLREEVEARCERRHQG